MASQIVNGSSADDLSPAQQLMEKHGAEDHRPTVEDAVDEDDIEHPPPSMQAQAQAGASKEPSPTPTPTPAPASARSPAPAEQPLSEKAAGKQPAGAEASAQSSRKTAAPLNPFSEEAFPALGAPKAAPAAAPSMWSKKPASVGRGPANGANGVNGLANSNGQLAASNASSRAATPRSGMMTPPSNIPTVGVSLPGRHTERIQFAPSQILGRQQLKKPLADVLRDINKRSKATVNMSQGAGGVINFESTGPTPDVVRQALKDVASQVGSKQSVKVPVPLSVRPHIIGRGGTTINALMKKTGARIQVPRESPELLDEDDEDSATIDVAIEGDAVAAEMARREIENIVGQRTSNINTRLRNIPAEFYPFLAGPHGAGVGALEQGRDLKVQIPHYHTWKEQAPQVPASRQAPVFAPQASLPISLLGDRQAAAEARAQLERQVAELQRQLVSEQFAIERGRHQFILGDNGSGLHDFLAETGCTVVLPPDSEDSETLTIVGPPEKLDAGIEKIMQVASEMSMHNVDFTRHTPEHARNITRYLQRKQAIAQLERAHNARIVAQSTAGGVPSWQVFAKQGPNAMRARADVMNLIQGLPPTRLTPVPVDPFFHQHLRQQAANDIRRQFGVHVVVPDDLEDADDVLLVYEGPSSPSEYELPRRQPSPNEVKEFERALQEAQKHLLSLISGQQEIVSRELDAPQKFHDKIRRHVDRQQSGLPADQIPLQVFVGGPARQAQPKVAVRGPSDRTDAFVQDLLAFIEQEKQDELERGFTLSFDFPQKFANQLIGKKGENIKKLRDEFDVDIQVNEGKVEIKGPEAKANACKSHIIAMGKKLEDEATHILKVDPHFHKDLIGRSGGQVNRLQERYNVRIQFPRSGNVDDDVSVADGEAAPRRPAQAPDQVVVRGPSRGADAARDELLSLLQYIKDNSHESVVSVQQAQLPSLIGSGGRELDALRLRTGAQIDVPNARDAADASGRVQIKIKGSKQAVADAKKEIEGVAKAFDAIVTRTLDVERKHHRTIIGSGGSNLRDLVVKAGGPDDRQKQARMVRFPRQESDGNTIRVEATQDVADKIVEAIQALVSDYDNQKTEVIEVAPEKHSKLIGAGGNNRRDIESKFGVSLDIPRRSVTGPERSQVKVTGKPDAVAQAKEHIATLTKDQEGATVNVPLKFHHAISDNGQFFRRLRNDHRVTVDHAGQKPPAKPEPLAARKGGAAMPLITDDGAGAGNTTSWTLHDLYTDAPTGEIPWVLSGNNAEDVEKARARLQAAINDAQKQDHRGYLILPDPRSYRLVVGAGGAEIKRIRDQTQTKIQVPKAGSGDEAIEIAGSKEGCEQARDIILGIVGAK